MDEKYKKRYESFQKSLKVMKDILIQYYAITGFVTSSPREVLRESFRADLISDDLWLEMLTIRNQLTHDYNSEIIKRSCRQIVEKYIDLFYCLDKTISDLNIQRNHRKCQKAHSGIVSSRQGLGQARTLARRLYKKRLTQRVSPKNQPYIFDQS